MTPVTRSQLIRLGDDDLLLRVAEGDAQAFETIYDRHSARAFGLAMRVTGRRGAAEEVIQDVFVGIWRAARKYDKSRASFSTWLLSMVRNRSIDWLRREARPNRDVDIDDTLVAHLQAAERTEEQVLAREHSHHTRQLLLGLPDDQRQVIELAYFHGLSQTEIASKVGVPLGTVKGRQRLALTKMHRRLSGRSEVVSAQTAQVRRALEPA